MRFQPCPSAFRVSTIGCAHPRRRLAATTTPCSKSSVTLPQRRVTCTKPATSASCPRVSKAREPGCVSYEADPSSRRCRHRGRPAVVGLTSRGPNNLVDEDHLFRHL